MNRVRGVYGRLRSLYIDLDYATVSKLEEAILYGLVRDFESSLAIFESFPDPIRHKPVVALEHCLALWNQALYLDGVEILDNAISYAEKIGQDVVSYGVFTLFRLYIAHGKIFTQGQLLYARDSLLEVRAWLQDFAIEEMDDVEVDFPNLLNTVMLICIIGSYYQPLLFARWDGCILFLWIRSSAIRNTASSSGKSCKEQTDHLTRIFAGTRTPIRGPHGTRTGNNLTR